MTLYRLVAAFKIYLRFEHALATVVASQIIVALAVLTVVDYTPGMLKHLFECIVGLERGYW